MKKHLLGFIVSLILVFWPTTLTAAYDQYVQIIVTNNNTASYSYLPVLITLNNSQLASYGYILNTGLDTNFAEGAASLNYSLTQNRAILVIPSLIAGQSRTYQYQMGYSPAQTDYPFATGYGGNVSVSDTAALELGDNFSLEISGYIDASAGANKNIILKGTALQLYISAANTITGGITANVLDQQQTTQFSYPVAYGANWLAQTFTPSINGSLAQVDLYLQTNDVGIGDVDVGLYATTGDLPSGAALASYNIAASEITVGSPAWYNIVFSAPYTVTAGTRYAIVISNPSGDASHYLMVGSFSVSGNPYADGRRCNSVNSGGSWANYGDTDLMFKTYVTSTLTVSSAITSGEHIVRLGSDNTSLKLYVDGVEADSENMSGTSVANNSNDYILGQNNVMPYVNYYKHTVSGVQKAWLQPVTLINPLAIADRSGNGNTGLINYGANPQGIEISIGAITGGDYTASGGSDDDDPAEVMSPGGGGFENTSATGSNLPYYDIFDRAADSMGTSTQALYGLMAIFVAILVLVAVAIGTGSTMMGLVGAAITAGVGAAMILGPWVVLIMGLGGAMLLYVYRRT